MKRTENVFFIAMIGVLGFALVANATMAIRLEWLNTYPAACGQLRDAADFCTLCHNDDFSLNPYAADYVEFGRSWQAIEGIDSDGDTVPNLAEIGACTFPGDPNSFTPIDPASWGGIKALYR